MDAYSRALSAYLTPDDRTQEALGNRIGRTQAAISRYATGARLPDAKTARAIHDATDGDVSFALWQQVAVERLGIAEAA